LLARLLGCDGDFDEDPDKQAILILIGQALIGMVHAGALGEALAQMIRKHGGMPMLWVKPKGA
jgi:hypothetical protein